MRQKASFSLLLHTFVLTHIAGPIDSAILSRNKVITSSSTWRDWVPERVIDGNPRRDGDTCECCAATNGDLNPWYVLDLGKQYTIQRIHVEGRQPGNGQHFRGMQIYLKRFHDGIAFGKETGITDATYNVDYVLLEPKSTRYITLVLYNEQRVFTICELTVYGECADRNFGENCENTCYCDGDPCNKTTGVCPSGVCLPGYEGPACDKECTVGTYGSGCTETCGNCSGSDICNKQDGKCPNECASGYKGERCTQQCPSGFYGPDCIYECGHCHDGEPCNRETGHCENGCVAGYKTDRFCKTECADRNFGENCENTCYCDGDPCNKTTGVCPSGVCLPGYEGPACDKECTVGTYGSGCTETCGNCSGSDICNKQDGKCPNECASGYKGERCTQQCPSGFYGPDCIYECGHCHDGEPCNRETGHCENGCVAGYKTDRFCKTECDLGTYGVGCNDTCGNCKDGHLSCVKADGVCSNGCIPGYKGDICKTECDDGNYGEDCNSTCGNCLDEAACNKDTGVCVDGCTPGYTGDLCVDECERGFYGNNCNTTCGNCSTNTTCHHTTGTCIVGCKIGFQKPLCQEECDDGFYGIDCLEECGRCYGNEACDKKNGTCSKCENGFTGDNCTSELSGEELKPGSPAAAIGGTVGGVAGILVVIIVIIITVRRRRMKPNAASSESDAFSRIDERKDPGSMGNSGNKRNVAEKPSSSKSSSKPKEIKKNNKTHTDGPSAQTNKETDMYYGFLTRATDLKICQLWDYISQKKKDGNLLFYQEFNRLTSGLQHPHEVALMKRNLPLTRYKELWAYDHSRVPLDTSDGGNGFINASFINGTDTPRKFIASQGPTNAMRNDFWRMVWQYNSCKIVMLTNLYEMGTEKCLIYWPEEESTDVTYGNITVSLVSKHVTTDCVIRNLKVRKNSSPARSVTQYHFKAWPDKNVPDSTWSLVEFWRTVMEDSIGGTAPIVVHCSAGIGRTGTFIAMDNAYHQAKGTGNITMLDLVKTLRDQRVNMVQTKDQYVFLHEAVADALLFGTHIIWSRDFENIYTFLTHKGRGRSTLPIQEQFNLITESVEDRKRLEQRNDAAVSADIYSNIFSNDSATETSVTIDEYMPKSKSMDNVREHGAVLLPNYEMKDAFIVCRSPTGSSFEGFWSIISEQNIKTVIMMTDNTSKHYKKCKELGASEKKVESSFGVKCLEESTTNKCFHKRFTFDSMDGPKDVSQFEFKNWPNGCVVPKDSRSMLDFLEIVLQWQQRLTSTQPILVHCSTGFERSGLVCVLLNELERMKREQGHINILQTVKVMKERNDHIIPNLEQYKYVYDTILETFHKDTASEETVPEDSVYENCQR